jgi:hypothetical protein
LVLLPTAFVLMLPAFNEDASKSGQIRQAIELSWLLGKRSETSSYLTPQSFVAPVGKRL